MSDKPTPSNHGEVLRMVTDVIASYLKKNPVAASDLPNVIATVYNAFTTPQASAAEAAPERPEPAVPIKRSVTPDYIICLEDGKQLKMLKRHLATSYNMTPDEYRARWGLPPDYPMVAPNYATQRSTLAKQIGLGSRARDERPAKAKAKVG
ncbi:MucR family transcriptional regulator [Aliidongia dinghuensis]|uniref:MucR family transcriptional regulator n=1 Tax=Aliidongia dinghuensis TaxID=1867774 RepID=A0A8J2YU79_9PROT|nr:MucR family transcriptional regulator [Aliidongia dinghuensis]GGF22495.1 MucR family transcriptional regulator [Aliidongia dinghuensis]